VLQLLIYLFGALSTALAIVGQDVWLPFGTACVSAIAAAIDYSQSEPRLSRSNQASNDLKNIQSWWKGLPPGEMLKVVVGGKRLTAEAQTRFKMLFMVEDVIAKELGWSNALFEAGDADEEEEGGKKGKEEEKEGGEEEGGEGDVAQSVTAAVAASKFKTLLAEKRALRQEAAKDEPAQPKGEGK
jgi:hypothetical protein